MRSAEAIAAARGRPGEDIAIVGMAGIFPRAGNVREFWQNIMQRVDGIGDPPPQWRPETFVSEGSRENDRIYTGKGGYLGDNFRFDPSRYGVVPTAMDGAEPDQFLALRVAYEALADAGAPSRELPRERTGVILGRGVYINRGSLTWAANGYFVEELVGLLRQLEPDRSESEFAKLKAELKRRLPPLNQDTVPGLISSIIAGRVANRFDLRGPAYMVDAACASSLLAVEQGMRALHEGRCDAVLAGGVQASTPPLVQVVLAQVGALSPQGRITPFSREASGMLVGEGCGMLLLMRRSDAERQGHRIYCLLKGMGSSSDGKGSGILAPKSAGQQLAVKQAYAESGISPQTVSLIEAHGTGTPVGDAAELDTVFEAFGERSAACPQVAMGTVKSMIGHLLPAAGAASLIKTALALYHRTLPPTLHGETAVDRLQAEDGPIYLVSQPRPWVHADRETPRRAAVNAFGFGGINAHAVLEEYAHPDQNELPRFERQWPCELVVLSADSRDGLLARCTALAAWLEGSAAALVDVAATCARERGAERLAIVAADVPELIRKLKHAAKLLGDPARVKIQDRGGVFWFSQPLAREGRIAFVFPGEGAQYPGMLSELCRHFPAVRRQFDLTDAGFLHYGQAGLLSQVIYPPRGEGKTPDQALLNLEGAVGAVTAANRALLALLEQLEVRPGAVVGHSSGEFAALYAAGAHRPADDEALVAAISEGAAAAARINRAGLAPDAVLTAVGGVAPAAVARALAEAGGRVVVAMDNCPNQLVVSGNEASTEQFVKSLFGQGGLCERLMWGRAYHTAAFAPACQPLDDYYRFLELQSPSVELWSCATADRFPAEPAAVRELAVRQWRSPVRFRETIENMHAAGVRLFVEVGPRGGLTGFVSDALGDRPHVAVGLDSSRRGGLQQLCQALGLLVAHGVDAKLEKLYATRSPAMLDFSQPPLAPPEAIPPLPFGLPRFSVSDELAREWQGRQPRASQGESPRPAAAATKPRDAQTKSDSRGNGHGHSNGHQGANGHRPPPPTPAPPLPGRVAPVAAPSAAPPAPPRIRPEPPRPAPVAAAAAPAMRAGVAAPAGHAALADFQRTMQEFLGLQQRVITSALQGGRGAPVMPGPPVVPAPNARRLEPAPSEPSAARAVPASLAAPAPARSPVVHAPPVVPPVAAPVAVAPPASAGLDREALLLDIISQRTGYPASMLAVDVSLEADLGIDSIKRVEILGAFRSALWPNAAPPEGLMERLTAATTPAQILAALATDVASSAVVSLPAEAVGPVASGTAFDFITLVHEPPHRVLVECEIDPDVHTFLQDHTFFGRDISAADPALRPLFVMPLAMSLELMAEAGSLLRPGMRVVALRDVQTMRWLTFEGATRRLRIEVLAQDGDDLQATIYEADAEGMAAAVATGWFEFRAEPNDLGPAVLPDNAREPGCWKPEELYGCGLFHGPAFRAVRSCERADMHGVRAEVVEPDERLMFPTQRPPLLLPVALIDSLGQMSGMPVTGVPRLGQTELEVTYPNRIARLEFVENRPANTSLLAIVPVERDGNYLRYHAELIAPDGRVLMRAIDRVDEIVQMAGGIYLHWSHPRSITLNRELTDQFADLPGIGAVRVCRTWAAGDRQLVKRLWQQVLARMVLSREERRWFDSQKLPPVPAVTWLLGRIAAKDAVRLLTGFERLLPDIPVVRAANGRPLIAWENAPQVGVSLAHKGFLAVAAACQSDEVAGVGIDLEPAGAEPLAAEVRADAFTPRERQLIESAVAGTTRSSDAWHRAAWTAKEAFGKALGTGLAHPLEAEVTELDPHSGRMTVCPRGALAEGAGAGWPGGATAACREIDGSLITVCILPRA